jgi:thioredoxin 1
MQQRTFILNDREDFKQFIKTNNHVIVKITAKWCGPCKKSKPLFENLFLNLPNSFKYIEVDVDECKKLSGIFKAKSIPTFINYIDGYPQDVVVGGDEEVIKSFFTKTKARLS